LLSRANLRNAGATFLLWAFLAAAAIGFAIGLRFRVTMLFAAAVIFTAVTLTVAIYSAWPASRTIEVLIGLLAIQQLLYLIGLFASGRVQKRGGS
jgi:hypothetical protein